MKKIAVYVNPEGITTSISEAGLIKIYDKDKGIWSTIGSIPCSIDFSSGLGTIRQSIIEVVSKITDCKIFVASEVIGQLYFILEAKGFTSYEALGDPLLFLDSIIESEAAEANQKDTSEATSILPEMTEQCGVYVINLKKALASNPTLSSKNILKPFLLKEQFEVLEVLCDHIPRWFDMDLKSMGLTFTTLKFSEQEYKILIKK